MTRLTFYNLIKNLINVTLSVVAFFLILRVLFLLFSVNPTTPFVAWVLNVSGFLIIPFAGIVPDLRISTGVVDLVALITLVAYWFAGYLITSLFYSLAESELLKREEKDSVTHYHDVEPKEEHTQHYLRSKHA